jgi:hypothetical protein
MQVELLPSSAGLTTDDQPEPVAISNRGLSCPHVRHSYLMSIDLQFDPTSAFSTPNFLPIPSLLDRPCWYLSASPRGLASSSLPLLLTLSSRFPCRCSLHLWTVVLRLSVPTLLKSPPNKPTTSPPQCHQDSCHLTPYFPWSKSSVET